jgi:glucokinase
VSLAIGVDIGGTKVMAGVVDDAGDLLAVARRRTPGGDPALLADVVVGLVEELSATHAVTAVGIGAAGYVDSARKTVLFAANLAWRNAPLHDQIASRVACPVVIENDANAAAWAEVRFGAGEQEPEVTLLTIGTGIGCGLVIGGRIRRGRFGIAGEPGHMRVVPEGRRCGCGNRGCFEQYCSGTALVRAARHRASDHPERASILLDLARGDVARIDGPTVTRAAQAGDPVALDCFTEIGRWLGQGLADMSAIVDPGRFVIGGGVGEAGELLLATGREAYAEALSGRGYRPMAEVVSARLGERAGVIGAADLARLP